MSSVNWKTPVSLVFILVLAGCGGGSSSSTASTTPTPPTSTPPPVTTPPPTTARTYSTSFPATENPISEGSNWVAPSSVGAGAQWGNVRTSTGFAYGASMPTSYGDPTAMLTGTWGANQDVSGTVAIKSSITGYQEVELRLRTNMTATRISGYEAYCSITTDQHYCHIGKWAGENGHWCNIESQDPGYSGGASNGDTLRATVSGTNPVHIVMYKNGVQILHADDAGGVCNNGGGFPASVPPLTSGAPGIGMFGTALSQFGFSSFSAKDVP